MTIIHLQDFPGDVERPGTPGALSLLSAVSGEQCRDAAAVLDGGRGCEGIHGQQEGMQLQDEENPAAVLWWQWS